MVALGKSWVEMADPYKGKSGYSVNQDVFAKNDTEFLVTSGKAPSMVALEWSLDEATELYKGKLGDSVDQDVVAKKESGTVSIRML